MIDSPVTGRVSIVVLNWNSGPLGLAATTSAVDQTWPDVELVVVDNASTDDSLATIITGHPDVRIVRNPENLGFSGGMNSGIAVATGEYIVPLNCDAELDPDYCTRLIAVLNEHPRAAAAGGQVASSRVATSGPLRITPTMRTAPLPVDRPTACDKVNGACPLFRTAALRQVVDHFGGPYDGTYFTYGEDIDLAKTLGRLGWEYRYDPGAHADHVRSFGSAPRLADRRGELRTTTLTNRHRNIVRHGRRPWWAVTAFAFVQDVGFAGLRLVRGDRGAPRDVIAAWCRLRRTISDDRRRRQLLTTLPGEPRRG